MRNPQSVLDLRNILLLAVAAAGCSTGPQDTTNVDLTSDQEPVLGQDQFFGKDDLAPEQIDAGTDAGSVAVISPLATPPQPLPGARPEDIAAFQAGLVEFQSQEAVDEGLGPVFNGNACGGCHSQPGPGGGSTFFETRFGRVGAGVGDAGAFFPDAASGGQVPIPGPGTFDFSPLANLGGDLQQFFSIGSEGTPAGCSFPIELIPPQANVTTLRRSTSLLGLGLVDNTPDEVIRLLAALEEQLFPNEAGHVATAGTVADPTPRVSKFGWKDQVPTLFEFSGNAYVNEMGITTPDFPLENCPNDVPNCPLVQRCDPVPGLDDPTRDAVTAFFNFMTFVAPLPRGATTPSVTRGQKLFTSTGCANCHTPTLITGPNASPALNKVAFHPYSDFLLHDMGTSGDGIGPDQGNATGNFVNATTTEMRTAPLWGIGRTSFRFLHDGRARTIGEAVTLGHDGQGARSRSKYLRLSSHEQQDLTNFVLSL